MKVEPTQALGSDMGNITFRVKRRGD